MDAHPTPTASPREWIEAWLRTLGRSPSTLTAYRRGVEQLMGLAGLDLDEAGALREAPDTHDSLLMAAAQSRWSASTVSQRFYALRASLAWVHENGGCGVSPLGWIQPVAAERSRPTAITRGVLDRFIGAVDAQGWAAIRDRALLSLAFDSAALPQETVGLRRSAVDLGAKTIRIAGVGRDDRHVPFEASTSQLLCAWLDVRASRWSVDDRPELFVSRTGGRLDRHRLYRMVNEAARRAGVSRSVSPMALRHGRALEWAQKGMSSETLCRLLGHKSRHFVGRYAEAAQGDLSQIRLIDRP